MEADKLNRNAFNFSPHFWWKYMELAVTLTEKFGKELIPDFNFRKWLMEECVEHPSLELYDEGTQGIIIDNNFRSTITNDYYYQVAAINKYGHRMKAGSKEELFAKHDIDKDANLYYIFKVDDLNHFATSYFMKWLVYSDDYNYIRWQLYYDFTVSKLNEPLQELYHYMWAVLLGEVNYNERLFNSIKQYKKFRNRLEEIGKRSENLEQKIVALRSATQV